MSKGGGGKTTSTTKVEPWGPSKPYLTDIFGRAQGLFGAGGWSPAMGAVTNNYGAQVAQRPGADQIITAPVANQLTHDSLELGRNGSWFAATTPSDLTTARTFQGALDPTEAAQSILSGHPDNPYLAAMQRASMDTAMRGYGDTLRSAATNYLPAIRSGAEAAGQYGGSRQGIAEGLVGEQLARNARDIGIAGIDAGTNLYGNAYQQAQQNKYGLTSSLNDQAAQWALNRGNFGLNQMAAAGNLGNQAVQIASGGNQLQNQNYQDALSALQAPNNWNWQNLGNYSGIIQPGAQLGRTTQDKQPYYTNPGASVLGGALGGASLASMLPAAWGVSSGMGALGGGALSLLGLLSDRRAKTDIEKVGKLDSGLTVYRYRYKAGGPLQIGVMAQEAEKQNPDAVQTVGGIKFVNYGAL